MSGLSELDDLPSDRLLTIRYEEIIRSPQELVSKIGELFDDVRPEWEQQAAAMVEPQQRRWVNLPAYDGEALADAGCPCFGSRCARPSMALTHTYA